MNQSSFATSPWLVIFKQSTKELGVGRLTAFAPIYMMQLFGMQIS